MPQKTVPHSFSRDPSLQVGMAQKTGLPNWVALSGNMGTKTCGLPLRSFNFEPLPSEFPAHPTHTSGLAAKEATVSLWNLEPEGQARRSAMGIWTAWVRRCFSLFFQFPG